jgi:hypothetical protein
MAGTAVAAVGLGLYENLRRRNVPDSLLYLNQHSIGGIDEDRDGNLRVMIGNNDVTALKANPIKRLWVTNDALLFEFQDGAAAVIECKNKPTSNRPREFHVAFWGSNEGFDIILDDSHGSNPISLELIAYTKDGIPPVRCNLNAGRVVNPGTIVSTWKVTDDFRIAINERKVELNVTGVSPQKPLKTREIFLSGRTLADCPKTDRMITTPALINASSRSR